MHGVRPMVVKVRCDRCGTRVPVENQQPGQQLRCTECWAPLEAPVTEAVELSDEWEEVVDDVAVVEEAPVAGTPVIPAGSGVTRPKLKRKKKKKKPDNSSAKKWLLIGLCSLPGLILVPLLIWGIATLFQTTPPPVIPENEWKVLEQ